ncbi:MAG: HEPN domain-containing protein [Pseudomonadota bacterium]
MKKKNKKLATEWLDRAKSDLQYAAAGEKETEQHHITCFLCHQAVEKALKGLAVLVNKTPKKTHNLGLLMSEAISEYKSFLALQKDVRRLDKYYIPARYPDDMVFEFAKEDAQNALTIAKHVIDLAKTEIE